MGIQDKIKGEAIIVEGNGAAKSAKTFELLMTELAELEFRIQQSVDQSASLRVSVLNLLTLLNTL